MAARALSGWFLVAAIILLLTGWDGLLAAWVR